MSQSVVARRYAKALLGLTVEKKVLETTGGQLAEIAETFKASTDLQEAMASNKMAFAAKEEILAEVLKRLKSSELVRTFCHYLLSKRRMELLPAIGRAFEGLLMEQLDRLEAHVSVTHKLTEASVKKLEKTLSRVTGKQVHVETRIDTDLIGGVVSRIGSTVIDGSIRNQLHQIRQSISQGGTL